MPPTYTPQSKSSNTLNSVEIAGTDFEYDDNQYTYDDVRLLYDSYGVVVSLTTQSESADPTFSNTSKS